MEIALGKRPELEYKDPQLVRLADATVFAVITEKQYGLTLVIPFKETKTPEEIKNFLPSSSPLEREAALDNYPRSDKTILRNLVDIVRSDDNLSVLHKAVNRFNELTGQSFMFWQAQDLLNWWDNNQKSFE